MNVTSFQNIVPVPCARVPVKLRFAKIQIADPPPQLPSGRLFFAGVLEQSAAKARAGWYRPLVFCFEELLGMLAF